MASTQCVRQLLGVLSGVVVLASAVPGASVADLRRAATHVPRPAYKGETFSTMNAVLNGHLKRIPGLVTAPCDHFTMQQLQDDVLAPIFEHTETDLLSIYAAHGDNRQRVHASIHDTRAEWEQMAAIVADSSELQTVRRDGLCHEAVLWFVHHLTAEKRHQLVRQILLPLLPEQAKHELSELKAADASHVAIHKDYATKVSCQQCHSGPTWSSWVDATLPLPLPVDVDEPGRERKKSCDYQNKPACGPCDGLGGPRTGDGLKEFDPVNCTVISDAEDVPESDRVRASFPELGHASIHGDTRTPLQVRPDPKTKGKYPKVVSTISLGWDEKVMRHRYDFQNMPPFNGPMAQIYLQDLDDKNSTGVMVTIIGREHHIPSLCICMSGVAGVMHLDSFVPHGKDDPLDLPGEEGGLSYLGRIRLQLDGAENRTAIADHYMKWAFHFLVDADPSSAGYGLPLRLYGAQGVRFIYSNWTTGDPRIKDPSIFEIPKLCVPLSRNCFKHFPVASNAGLQYV